MQVCLEEKFSTLDTESCAKYFYKLSTTGEKLVRIDRLDKSDKKRNTYGTVFCQQFPKTHGSYLFFEHLRFGRIPVT